MNPIEQAEIQFAQHFNMKYGVMLCNGTATLHCCLLAAGVRAGDEVIVPALTMASPAIAARLCGAKPVYADIDSKTFTMDPADMAAKITQRTSAIIAVSLYGLPANMDAIMAFAYNANIPVIEDSAQCLTPSCKADMMSFSFQSTKHISTGEGGMVLTNNTFYADQVIKYSNLGYRWPIEKDSLVDPNAIRHTQLGYNYRPSYLQAEKLLEQIPHIQTRIDERVSRAKLYDWALHEIKWLRPQYTPCGFYNSYWTYACVLEKGDWHEFVRHIQSAAGGRIYSAWRLAYQEPALLDEEASCPVAEQLQSRMIQFNTKHDIPYGGFKLKEAVNEYRV